MFVLSKLSFLVSELSTRHNCRGKVVNFLSQQNCWSPFRLWQLRFNTEGLQNFRSVPSWHRNRKTLSRCWKIVTGPARLFFLCLSFAFSAPASWDKLYSSPDREGYLFANIKLFLLQPAPISPQPAPHQIIYYAYYPLLPLPPCLPFLYLSLPPPSSSSIPSLFPFFISLVSLFCCFFLNATYCTHILKKPVSFSDMWDIVFERIWSLPI